MYSNVNVYEMEVNGVAVMRRREDSWLNATQILKVAGIEKGKRTKVLEKEILIGEHEKVQGGYGKYQGTWISFDRGLRFCKQYGVEELLRPLLTYDMGQDGGIAGQGGVDTPTKEQAMAAQRKRLYNASSETRLSGQSGTFFKNISSTASIAVAGISKARFDSPTPRRNGQTRQASFSRQSSQQQLENQENAFPNSQQSMQSFTTDNGNGYPVNGDSAYATQSQQPQYSHIASNGDFQEPPRKRMRPSPSASFSQPTQDTIYDNAPSPTEPNESFVYHPHSQMMMQDDEVPTAVEPLPYLETPSAERKRALIMGLFMDPTCKDFSNHEAFTALSPEDFEMPIDSKGHTALHWAATLARMELLRRLVAQGSNIYRVNSNGETALIRACVVTNNLDINSFPDLLELLGPTIEMKDNRGRTILHHIAVTAAVKGRSQATKYYLESLLEFVVRQGPASNSQQPYGGLHVPRSMGIGRFMSEIVNARDKSGDTALNLAARTGNRNIISQLLEVGADPSIPNRSGLRPIDFGTYDPATINDGQDNAMEKVHLDKTERESSGDIISSITTLLASTEAEFSAEMGTKQSAVDVVHASLRDSSASLGTARQRLESMRAHAKARDERKMHSSNVRRSAAEERYRLSRIQQNHSNGIPPKFRLGEADAAFLSLPADIPVGSARQHRQLIASLPVTNVLRPRANAYQNTDIGVEGDVELLKKKSKDLEARYKSVIALCTNTKEADVDGLILGLWRAVESEGENGMGDLEVGRVREFLGRVEATVI
jgi:regulatory protein SWI6